MSSHIVAPLAKGIAVAKPDAVPNVVPCAPGVFSLCKTLLTNPAGSATTEDDFHQSQILYSHIIP